MNSWCPRQKNAGVWALQGLRSLNRDQPPCASSPCARGAGASFARNIAVDTMLKAPQTPRYAQRRTHRTYPAIQGRVVAVTITHCMVKRLMLSMGLPSLRAQRREQLLPRVPERGARERRVDPDVFAMRFLNIPCLVSGAGRSWGPPEVRGRRAGTQGASSYQASRSGPTLISARSGHRPSQLSKAARSASVTLP